MWVPYSSWTSRRKLLFPEAGFGWGHESCRIVVRVTTAPPCTHPPPRRLLPEPDRHGTRFVFRSGSPLMPDDLRMVAACRWTRGVCI